MTEGATKGTEDQQLERVQQEAHRLGWYLFQNKHNCRLWMIYDEFGNDHVGDLDSVEKYLREDAKWSDDDYVYPWGLLDEMQREGLSWLERHKFDIDDIVE